MDLPNLTAEQAEAAEQLYQAIRVNAEAKIREIAALMASKPDNQLLGTTEFQVRDLVHQIGAEAIQTAVNQRKKGGTKGPV